MRRSQSLQHIDMRRNTVHREGACALLDALDKLMEKRECTSLRSRKAHANQSERSTRRGQIPLSSLPKNTRHVRQNMMKISPHMRQWHSTQALRNKSNSTHVDTKEAREPSLLTFNTIALTQLASGSARRGRAPRNRIWSAVGITTYAGQTGHMRHNNNKTRDRRKERVTTRQEQGGLAAQRWGGASTHWHRGAAR